MKHSKEKIDNLLLKLKKMGLFEFFEKSSVCGSYRREKVAIGDLDIVMIPKQSKNMVAFFKEHSIKYKRRYLGYQFHIDDVKIDLFNTSEKDYWLNVLMWTGPHYFTMNIRAKFYKKGYRLTTRMISSLKTKISLTDTILIKSEKELFDFIKIPYVEPKDRF